MGVGINSGQSHAALRVAVRAAVKLPILRRDRTEPSPDGLRAHLLRSVREGLHVRKTNSPNQLKRALHSSKDKCNFQLNVYSMHLKGFGNVQTFLFSVKMGEVQNVPLTAFQ